MSCNKITPPEFTKQQIDECKQCKHASGKKVWCCLFGVCLIESGKILVPDKRIKYPSLPKMGMGFAKAAGRHVMSGLKKRTEKEQQKCQMICKACEYYIEETKIGSRCKLCGCCTTLKARWATSHCTKGKW